MTDFGMARDVQQENIYERKTKVIKKEVSLVIFRNHCCSKADVFLISMKKALDGTLKTLIAINI